MKLCKKETLASGEKWIFDVDASELELSLPPDFYTNLQERGIEFKPTIAVFEDICEGRGLNNYTIGLAFDSSSPYGVICNFPAASIDDVIWFLENFFLHHE